MSDNDRTIKLGLINAVAEIGRLRADLAAERERTATATKAWECAIAERNEWQAEAEKLREVAKRARRALVPYREDRIFGYPVTVDEVVDAIAAIDTVLEETGGGDE